MIVKAHMPDLATSCPSSTSNPIEKTAGDTVDRFSRRRVEFESLDFNKRFIATVPKDHDRWRCASSSVRASSTGSRRSRRGRFGITEKQLFFHWRLRNRTKDELKESLRSAGGIFDRLHREMEENNLDIYKPGPWNAGLEPFRRRSVLRAAFLQTPAIGPVEARPLLDEVPVAPRVLGGISKPPTMRRGTSRQPSP